VASGMKEIRPSSEVRLHLALYHTGRLTSDLFSFPNQVGWDLLPGLSKGTEPCRAESQTLLELGQVGPAEHYAHEAWEMEGDRPDTLNIIAKINILKDRPRAARVFLNLARQFPFEGEWAASALEDMKSDPALSHDPEIARIRGLMVTTDLPHDECPTEQLLRQLLHSNKTNQMAFEYLVAHYLLTLELKKVMERVGQMPELGYQGIPRHCEEAILLFQQRNHILVDLRGRSVRPETIQRFRAFSEPMRNRAFQTAEGRAAMARDFGDTYWFYYYTRPAAMRNNPTQSASL
jgi:hypothetical protein